MRTTSGHNIYLARGPYSTERDQGFNGIPVREIRARVESPGKLWDNSGTVYVGGGVSAKGIVFRGEKWAMAGKVSRKSIQ